MARDLQFTDDRLVARYDALNTGEHDWRFYEARIGTAADEGVDGMLTAVRERLRPGGRLMFESRNPATRPWLRWHGHELVSVRPRFVTFDTRFQVDGEELVSRSTLRFLPQAELAERLTKVGFTEVEWCGDWAGEPYDDATSPEIIAIARSEGRGSLLP